jgi:glycosyltransferase involved in cell wall biosynthesis
VVANTSWYIYNFRRNLLQDLRDAGHHVVSIAPTDEYSSRLIADGIPHRHLPLKGASTNPLREAATVVALRRLLQEEQVDVVLSYTPKGNIYSGLAVIGRATHLVANVSGLGRVFVRNSWLTILTRWLYRLAFGRAVKVFFQNEEDQKVFIEAGLVNADKSERIPGSGVDLTRFSPADSSGFAKSDAPTFLLIARILWDKGVGEFVDAARFFKVRYPAARFQLLGFLDVANPSAVPRQTVSDWIEEGVVEYLGTADDVRPYLVAADCFVLPSFYREGVPRSLLEAAAMGKPVITTDAIGCRDTVDDGITGFLCHPRDAKNLADKMVQFVSMSMRERQAMGARGREKMICEFDERIVINRYLAVVSGLTKSA